MPLTAGDKLGHYEVLSLLGQGGMGEVYRALDTTLKREVALKVLPSAFLRDSERLARFQREAEVLASLDHPNIGPIYGLVDSQDSRTLVLALIEGPTLADRIRAGPIPIDEAIAIAKQIIQALEYAHDRGVVHRDLKPANVKITSEGVVKVLDFGLAKVLEDEPASSSLGNSPTLTMGHTRAGMIMGTAEYMSPEQAVGRPVDRRSDIFSFGAVVFEMVTGKRAFTGATAPDALEAVVKFDPDWAALPTGTPAYLRRLMERSLKKDRKQRLQAIGEARIILENTDGAGVSSQTEARSTSKLAWAMTVAAVVFALAIAFLYFREKPPGQEMVRFEISASANTAFGDAVVSPDGRQVAFVVSSGGQSQIFVRALGEATPRPLTGTEGADSVIWSSDSRSVAFAADQKLKRLDIAGGATQTICDIAGWAADKGETSGSSGSRSWNPNGVLLIPHGEIFRVSASGGTPEPATALDSSRGEIIHAYPEFLPDGRHFLFVAAGQRHEDSALWVGSLDSPKRIRVASVDTNVSFVSRRLGSEQGYLVYGRNSTLVAQPFDAAKLQTTGEAFPITEGVDYANAAPGTLYRTQFSVSATGAVLAYSPPQRRNSQLVWFDRTGHRLGTIGPSAVFNNVSLASDGKRIALDPLDTTTNGLTLAPMDIWTIDSVRGTYSRLTFEKATNWFPCFSPDGNRLVFTSNRAGRPHLYIKSSTGAGSDERLLKNSTGDDWCGSWSADGRSLAYYHRGEKGVFDIWIAPVDGDPSSGERKPILFLQSAFNEAQPRFSPDGNWIAYTSDESGKQQVYVQPYSPGKSAIGKWQVSLQPGADARWRRDGKELYYLGTDGKMMAVDIRTSGGHFEAGVPRLLFETRTPGIQIFSSYGVRPDGRFLIRTPAEQANIVPIVVIVNWMAGLKK